MITGEDDFRSGIGAFIHRRLWRENVGRRTYIGMAIDELKKLGDRYFRFREQVFTPPMIIYCLFLHAHFIKSPPSISSVISTFFFENAVMNLIMWWCLTLSKKQLNILVVKLFIKLNDSLNKLEDKLSETDAKIKDEVDVKYQDNLKTVRDLGERISIASKEALAANKKMDGVSTHPCFVFY